MKAGGATKLREHLLARTSFFDRAVLEALRRGVDQVVIVGAGYDDRALRFRTPGVRFFELDHPDTQEDKRRRLRGIAHGPTLVPVDFESDPVGGMLAVAGQSDSRPTLFICEGLLVYLNLNVIADLLRGLASRAADGSELAASLAVHPFGMSSEALVTAVNTARGRSAESEPWQTILPAQAHLSLLRQAGWEEQEVLDDVDLVPEATPGHSLLVLAAPSPA
jgi:methyltransferase (TIGR00027 family)